MRTRLGGVAAVAALVTSGLTGSALADPGEVPAPGTRAAATGQDAMADQAQAALAEVAEIFGETPPGSGEVPVSPRLAAAEGHGREATMALRDLYLLKDSLSSSDRKKAEAFLARPTDPAGDVVGGLTVKYETTEATPVCDLNVCIHYVTTTDDAVPTADTAPADGIPDYVAFALATVGGVHTSYVTAGYKEPKPDGASTNNGGSALTDIYLADLATQTSALYGYCTSDDPAPNTEYDVSAYCVLDNDYSEFPGHTPEENLEVTAAHEYFHAVQYAYDVGEDAWFMEASATWAEDELFDDVNDNLAYLPDGQLGVPYIPLDTFTGTFHYGNWIFLRYLTEKYSTEAGGMPVLMRQLWDKVDAADPVWDGGTDPDKYAIQAIKAFLAAKNTTFEAQYALFADAGRRRTSFDEGVANSYPIKPLGGSRTLSTSTKSTGWLQVSQGGLDHQTSLTFRATPNSTLNGSAWRLRVELDLAPTTRGSAAVITVYKQGGGVAVSRVSLNDQGNKSVAVRFGKVEVKAVEITLVNASTRFNCWQDGNSPFSCLGIPKDDDQPALFRATAFR